MATFKKINPKTYKGFIPAGYDLVCVDKNDTKFDDALTLYGWDEVGPGTESNYKNPIYGFLKF